MTLFDGLTKFASRCQGYGPDFPHTDLEVPRKPLLVCCRLCCSAKRDRLNQWVIAAAAVRSNLEAGEIDWQDLENNLAIHGLRSCSNKPFWMLFNQISNRCSFPWRAWQTVPPPAIPMLLGQRAPMWMSIQWMSGQWRCWIMSGRSFRN